MSRWLGEIVSIAVLFLSCMILLILIEGRDMVPSEYAFDGNMEFDDIEMGVELEQFEQDLRIHLENLNCVEPDTPVATIIDEEIVWDCAWPQDS